MSPPLTSRYISGTKDRRSFALLEKVSVMYCPILIYFFGDVAQPTMLERIAVFVDIWKLSGGNV